MTNNDLCLERDQAASRSYTLHYMPREVGAKLAYSVMQEAFRGSITFKHSASGMRTTCYLHIFGHRIVKAAVNGCGYDTATHALIDALKMLREQARIHNDADYYGSLKLINTMQQVVKECGNFKTALRAVDILCAHIGG